MDDNVRRRSILGSISSHGSVDDIVLGDMVSNGTLEFSASFCVRPVNDGVRVFLRDDIHFIVSSSSSSSSDEEASDKLP